MLTFENSLTFSSTAEPDAQLRNFWGPENGFIWSSGKWCELTFSFDIKSADRNALLDLILDLDVFKHGEELKGQNVLLYLNGLRIGSLYCTKRSTMVFSFDARLLKAEENIFTMDTPDAASPSQFGSKDGRTLGVQLFSLQVHKVE
jgi:hypothetical protein